MHWGYEAMNEFPVDATKSLTWYFKVPQIVCMCVCVGSTEVSSGLLELLLYSRCRLKLLQLFARILSLWIASFTVQKHFGLIKYHAPALGFVACVYLAFCSPGG